jgi:hypothetical protein
MLIYFKAKVFRVKDITKKNNLAIKNIHDLPCCVEQNSTNQFRSSLPVKVLPIFTILPSSDRRNPLQTLVAQVVEGTVNIKNEGNIHHPRFFY